MFHNQSWIGYAVSVLLLTVGVQAVEAQDVAGSLEQLRSLVNVGDRVTVTDVAGLEAQGTIAEVSSSLLGLVVDGIRVDFVESDLDSVSKRDSRWNGTLWGLAIGAVVGTSLEKSLADEYGRDDISYGSVVVPFAGLGGAIGFAVDALIKGRRLIYTRSRTAAKSVTVSPMWNTRRKGIFVSLQF